LLTASLVSIVAAAACYLLMVRTALGQRFDHAAFLGASELNPGIAGADRRALQSITADSLAVVLVVIVIAGFLRRRLWLGVAAAAAAGLTVVVVDLLKDDILTRPYLTPQVPAAANTFPSGHTATAVACAMAIVLVSPPRLRGLAAVVAGAYGWITAVQVQTAVWHRPSDAIGAAFLAFAAITGVAAILAWWRPVPRQVGGRHWIAQAVLGLVAAFALVGAAWGLIDVVRYLRLHDLYGASAAATRHEAYQTGAAITVLVVAGLLMALLALIGRYDLGRRVRRL
jgi:membrane-associated phospholipid phosphatase